MVKDGASGTDTRLGKPSGWEKVAVLAGSCLMYLTTVVVVC